MELIRTGCPSNIVPHQEHFCTALLTTLPAQATNHDRPRVHSRACTGYTLPTPSQKTTRVRSSPPGAAPVNVPGYKNRPAGLTQQNHPEPLPTPCTRSSARQSPTVTVTTLLYSTVLARRKYGSILTHPNAGASPCIDSLHSDTLQAPEIICTANSG
jgi:hypothetical protein